MITKAKKEFNKYTHLRQEDLLTYHRRLCQARLVADLQGKIFLRGEIQRVREKVLFEGSLA